ncbi:MAG: AmmeMemoRadiSam system radical SAM enzyme [Candidatus Aureabacteria bacterium]|nr:AmmeMemoRadiSam system radical SAM enzyme [Candidatus Auribacterota bacterium]
MRKTVAVQILLFILLSSLPSPAFPEQEALFYKKRDNDEVQCELCPHRCMLSDGQRGFCRVRLNRNGVLYSLVFGQPCSVNVGPIEKAPFYHFLPGSKRLCVATAGCNMRCTYCQNWEISQTSPEDIRSYDLPPEKLVEKAKSFGVPTICFTYSEPIIFYEYMYATSKLALSEGLKTTMVSNGFINQEPMKKLLPYMSAVKIDLKSFSESFYQDVCAGRLENVLETLRLLKKEGKHFEIVVLVIPTLNDSSMEILKMCQWIHENLGDDVPLHFTRFVPAYKLTSLPMTPVQTLEKAHSLAKGCGLNYVYIGNVPGHMFNSTYCPSCKKRIVHRSGYEIKELHIKKGKCAFCGYDIPGVWE